ncbi:MAG: glycosyltransferase, partial [Chloroflexota bacterium]
MIKFRAGGKQHTHTTKRKLMDFSVIIPAYNAEKTLPDCIHALKNQIDVPGTYEIILVDNGSNDLTVDLAKAAGWQVAVQTKRGPGACRNMGLSIAQGDIICFTDADCAPLENWISEVTQPLREDSSITGCKGVYKTHQKTVAARFVQAEYEGKYQLLAQQEQIDFIDTYCAAYRHEALQEVNGFNEDFQKAEDTEMAYRLASSGHKLVFQPKAVVYHTHSATLFDFFVKKIQTAYWVAQLVRKHPRYGVRDSHNPQITKIQMLIMLLFLCALGAAPIWGIFDLGSWIRIPGINLPAWASLLLALVFASTTLPSAIIRWNKDRVIALLSPMLVAIRTLGHTIGYIWGVLRPI